MYNTILRRLAPLLAALALPTQAETITIGKGSGIMWEGMPFNAVLKGATTHPELVKHYGLLNITHRRGAENRCVRLDDLVSINGTLAFPIAEGVGLIPRATGTATYKLKNGTEETLTGTIGLPESKGVTSSGVDISNPVNGYTWCLPPRMNDDLDFYDSTFERTAQIQGNWVLITDGRQQNSEVKIPPMYAATYASVKPGDLFSSILPETITLRISNLACTVATPLTIDFGHVAHSTDVNRELAMQENPFNVSCTQDTNHISTNINVQLSAISGTYNGSPTKLALRQGGGYITGALDGLTGDGRCGADNGLPFDNTKQLLGRIENTENRQDFNHRVTWRLCSGGKDLPIGPVDASAELMVTFN